MATSKYVNQVCVIGDRRKYLSALVTLDPDNIAEYAQENGIVFSSVENLIDNEKVIRLINDEILKKNSELPSFETIKKVTIVPEFTIENSMLTPTLKVKKNVVGKQYKDEIDRMYPKE